MQRLYNQTFVCYSAQKYLNELISCKINRLYRAAHRSFENEYSPCLALRSFEIKYLYRVAHRSLAFRRWHPTARRRLRSRVCIARLADLLESNISTSTDTVHQKLSRNRNHPDESSWRIKNFVQDGLRIVCPRAMPLHFSSQISSQRYTIKSPITCNQDCFNGFTVEREHYRQKVTQDATLL